MHPQLTEFCAKLDTGVPVKALFFGTSITFGSQIDPAYDHDLVYHHQWLTEIKRLYKNAQIAVINRGVPGDKVEDAHRRLENDVFGPTFDLIVIEFGINDCWDGEEKLPEFERRLDELVSRILVEEIHSPVILMTANMLNHASSEEARSLAWFADKTAAVQNAGWTEHFMQAVRRVAARQEIPLADGYAHWEKARTSGIDTDSLLVNKANHPNREGHRLLAFALLELFRP